LKTNKPNSLQIGVSGLWGKEMKRSTFGFRRSRLMVPRSLILWAWRRHHSASHGRVGFLVLS